MSDSRVPPFYNISSDVGKLEAVLLHRPDKELERLTPLYLEELLFEDIPWLGRMQEEHDLFAEMLRDKGCEVYYYDSLLSEILQKDSVRARLIEDLLETTGITRLKESEAIKEFLISRTGRELTDICIAGLYKNEVPLKKGLRSLSYHVMGDYPFYISPLPNLYFTRDPGAVIGQGIAINSMKTQARKRESLLLWYIHNYFTEITPSCRSLWFDRSYPESIEGGDILVLNKNVLAIGCSARTSAEGIEKISENLINSSSPIEEILVIQIPFKRAYMHLDTVFTMVDRDKFIIYPGILEDIRVFSLIGGRQGLNVRSEKDLSSALCRALKLDRIQLIQSGGGDKMTAAREQWNDSTNTLAIAPGTVVTYRRNTVSNETLRDHGVIVYEIDGSELVRGRGGPRCMSMPLRRKELD